MKVGGEGIGYCSFYLSMSGFGWRAEIGAKGTCMRGVPVCVCVLVLHSSLCVLFCLVFFAGRKEEREEGTSQRNSFTIL